MEVMVKTFLVCFFMPHSVLQHSTVRDKQQAGVAITTKMLSGRSVSAAEVANCHISNSCHLVWSLWSLTVLVPLVYVLCLYVAETQAIQFSLL